MRWYSNPLVPTSTPTLIPTSTPTFAPTSTPTLALAHVSTTSLSPTMSIQEWEGGTTDTVEGVKHTFAAVDATSPKYLTVEVLPTDFDSNEFTNITINGVGYGICDPADLCGDAFYKCFRQVEVNQLVDTNGNIEVEVIGTSHIGTMCEYEGRSMYVRYTERTPNLAPTNMFASICDLATDCFLDTVNDIEKYFKCDMSVYDDFGANHLYYDDDDDNCGANEDLFNCFIKFESHTRNCKLR